MEVALLQSHHLAFCIQDLDFHRNLRLFRLLQIQDIRPNLDLFIVYCTDKERMTREVKILVCNDEVDITEETATRIPTGIIRLAGIRLYNNFIHLPPLQKFAQVDVKTQVAIIGTTDTLPIKIDIAHQHDTLEVEHDALSLPFSLGSKLIAIPADAHLLKATWTQSAAYIAARIAVIRPLAGIRSHPILSYQKIVWQIHHIISALG